MDQRYVRLGIQSQGDGKIMLKTPLDGTIAQPGYYMLFLLNGDGVPSVANFVHLV